MSESDLVFAFWILLIGNIVFISLAFSYKKKIQEKFLVVIETCMTRIKLLKWSKHSNEYRINHSVYRTLFRHPDDNRYYRFNSRLTY